jgi:predicted metal-dependent peptidase
MQQYTKPFRLLMNDNPFFGLYLLGVNKYEVDHSIPIAAVAMEGYNFKLLLRKGAYLDMPPEHQVGVLKHEILHISLGHLSPYYRNRCPDHKIFNIAADLEINQYIDRSELPEGCIQMDTFPDYDLPEKAGTVFYYDFLKQKIEDLKGEYPEEFYGDPCPGDGPDQGPKNPGDSPDGGQDEQEGSSPTSSGDKDSDSESQPGKGPSKSDQNLMDMYGQGDPSHSQWDKPDLEPGESETGYWEAVDEIRRQQVRRAYQEAQRTTGNKARGYIPGNLLETIDKLMEKKDPVVDWRSYFRRFVAASQNVVVKKTKRKESNRFIGMPGMKFNPRHDILVAVDTSGSVSSDELANFYTELNFIHKAGVKITVAQCDADISNVQKFSPSNQVQIHGRGGTDFDPPVQYLNKNKSKYTCLVYFTDGACSPPSIKTTKPILWVITRGERSDYKEQKFPGDVVIMKNVAT